MTANIHIQLIAFLIFLSLMPCHAQEGSDVYLFTLEKEGKGDYQLHSPKYLNSFNKGGFNNQPSFTPSGDLLLSVRKQDEIQNDIWLLSLSSRKYKQLTNTSATEYSPRIHPHEEHLTVVRRADRDISEQQICNIHLKTGEMECVAPDVKDAGYYTWLSPAELGLFRIDGNTNKLSYYNVEENKSRRITNAIGRTLLSDKAGWLIFVHKFTDNYWYIKKYDPSTSAIEIVTQTVDKNEDFTMAGDGTYFMGKGHLLFAFHPDKGKDWRQVADLSVYGIKFITRMAVSPDGKKLVVVSTNDKS